LPALFLFPSRVEIIAKLLAPVLWVALGRMRKIFAKPVVRLAS